MKPRGTNMRRESSSQLMDLACWQVSFLILLLLLPLLRLSLHKLRKKADEQALRLPPCPPKLPIIGNLHQLGNLPHRSLRKLSQRHGPLMFLRLGRAPTIVVSSAEMAEQVLRVHDLQCCSRPPLCSSMKHSYGGSDVAFAPYGDQWRELRKICITKVFSPSKNLFFQSIRQEEIERMMSSITRDAVSAPNNPIDLSDMLLSLANNIVTRGAAGKSYQTEGKMTWCRIQNMVKEAQAVLAAFFMADYIPWLGWVDVLTGMRHRLEISFLDFDDFNEQVIAEHLERAARESDDRDEDIVDTLLRIKKEANYLSADHIKGVLMNIFLAGTDTSSAAVVWAMTELMRNPNAMEKLQEEARSLIGTQGRVEERDLHQLKYLKSVVKETMRLHPPAPLLVHRETRQHFRIHGYDIPAKTRVIVNAWAIGREAASWDMPEEFYPERFMDSSVDVRGQDFQLIPFGSGRRICPALRLGLQTVELALANLVYAFDWEVPHGLLTIDLAETPGITVHKKFPLKLVATKFGGMEGSD